MGIQNGHSPWKIVWLLFIKLYFPHDPEILLLGNLPKKNKNSAEPYTQVFIAAFFIITPEIIEIFFNCEMAKQMSTSIQWNTPQ